jgi:hypothetical protein
MACIHTSGQNDYACLSPVLHRTGKISLTFGHGQSRGYQVSTQAPGSVSPHAHPYSTLSLPYYSLSLSKQSSNAGCSRLDLPRPATSGAIVGIHRTPSSSPTRSPHSSLPPPPGTTSPPNPSAIVLGSGRLAAVPDNDDSYLPPSALHLRRLVQQGTRPCPTPPQPCPVRGRPSPAVRLDGRQLWSTSTPPGPDRDRGRGSATASAVPATISYC